MSHSLMQSDLFSNKKGKKLSKTESIRSTSEAQQQVWLESLTKVHKYLMF